MIRREKNIDEAVIQDVLQILDGWQGKLTWELLIEAVAKRTGRIYTRQAFHKHRQINTAFKACKNNLRRSRPLFKRSSKSLTSDEVGVLMDRCARLEAENIRLRSENERLLLQFAVWSYNAHVRGLSEEYLNRPLQNIDREVTKIDRIDK